MLIAAKESMYAVTSSCSCSVPTPKSSPIRGKPGNGVSMLNGPIIDSIASTSGIRATNRGERTRASAFTPVLTLPSDHPCSRGRKTRTCLRLRS